MTHVGQLGHLKLLGHTQAAGPDVAGMPLWSSARADVQAEIADKQDRLREAQVDAREMEELWHQRLDTLPTLAKGNSTRSAELVRRLALGQACVAYVHSNVASSPTDWCIGRCVCAWRQ